MSALEAFRRELRALLGGGVLLRRDRSMRALFVCDAPRRLADPAPALAALHDAGFSVGLSDGLWLIDLSPARRAAWLTSLPDGPAPEDMRLRSLCRSLRARGDAPPGDQPWPLIRKTLLLLDAGDTERLLRELSADIAVCKRKRAPLPSAAAKLMECSGI